VVKTTFNRGGVPPSPACQSTRSDPLSPSHSLLNCSRISVSPVRLIHDLSAPANATERTVVSPLETENGRLAPVPVFHPHQ
jgi:hypothetical protein